MSADLNQTIATIDTINRNIKSEIQSSKNPCNLEKTEEYDYSLLMPTIIRMKLERMKEKPVHLDAFPGVSNGDGTMLLDDIEEGSGYRLPLLRRRFNCHGPHLRLRLLRQTSNRRPKHYLPQTQTLFCKANTKYL